MLAPDIFTVDMSIQVLKSSETQILFTGIFTSFPKRKNKGLLTLILNLIKEDYSFFRLIGAYCMFTLF